MRRQHPDVLSQGQKVFVVWKEFDGKEASVQGMHSSDGGTSCSPRAASPQQPAPRIIPC